MPGAATAELSRRQPGRAMPTSSGRSFRRGYGIYDADERYWCASHADYVDTLDICRRRGVAPLTGSERNSGPFRNRRPFETWESLNIRHRVRGQTTYGQGKDDKPSRVRHLDTYAMMASSTTPEGFRFRAQNSLGQQRLAEHLHRQNADEFGCPGSSSLGGLALLRVS